MENREQILFKSNYLRVTDILDTAKINSKISEDKNIDNLNQK